MSSQIKAKLLQHFAGKKKTNGGFTLIELLVVIIIIGILSAIALPSFLNQANKARQSEAKTYIGSINRAQQAYYMENNGFSDDIVKLGIGINDQTDNYAYAITASTTDPGETVNAQAAPEGGATASVKAYIGGVKIGTASGTGEATTLAILCEALSAPINGGADGTEEVTNADSTAAGAPTCDATAVTGFKTIK
jgi:type IV pilus assembly protein PilA